jgi:hypothetical protein
VVRFSRQPWVERVEGRADSRDLAEGVALVRAEQKLTEYLQNNAPGVQPPSTDYIRDNLVKERKYEDLDSADDPEEGKGKYGIVLDLRMDDKDYKDLLAHDRHLKEQERQGRVRERMLGLGKILAGLVALLAAVSGYFRLEEATKGYYTAWLRLGAIGFLGVVGLGIWLVS